MIDQQYNTILPLNILHSPYTGIFIEMRILQRTVTLGVLCSLLQPKEFGKVRNLNKHEHSLSV